ncbi:MAG: hypothetical protein QM503_00430 [Bacteroidota bacterium]
MSKLENNKDLSTLLSNYDSTFSDGFTNRVMDRIEMDKNKESNNEFEFYSVFRWVALSGIAAIVVLLFSVYITQGSFSADAIYGLVYYTPDEPIIASLNY